MQTDRLSGSAFQTAKMKAVCFQKALQVLGARYKRLFTSWCWSHLLLCSSSAHISCARPLDECILNKSSSIWWFISGTECSTYICNWGNCKPLILTDRSSSSYNSKIRPQIFYCGSWGLHWLVFISLFSLVTSFKVADDLVTFPTCVWPSWFTCG